MRTSQKIADYLGIELEKAQKIRDLFDGRILPEEFRSVQQRIMECYNEPPQPDLIMEALNEIIGGYGVEGCGKVGNYHDCPLLYVNVGDTYLPTICYFFDSYHYCSWGDAIERLEEEGIVVE